MVTDVCAWPGTASAQQSSPSGWFGTRCGTLASPCGGDRPLLRPGPARAGRTSQEGLLCPHAGDRAGAAPAGKEAANRGVFSGLVLCGLAMQKQTPQGQRPLRTSPGWPGRRGRRRIGPSLPLSPHCCGPEGPRSFSARCCFIKTHKHD